MAMLGGTRIFYQIEEMTLNPCQFYGGRINFFLNTTPPKYFMMVFSIDYVDPINRLNRVNEKKIRGKSRNRECWIMAKVQIS